jgi:SH3 domain-containing protein
MGGVFKALVVLVLLGVPLLVISALPRLLELVPSTTAGQTTTANAQQQFRLPAATPTTQRSRFAALEETPPPTLAPPAATATSAATPRPTATGERIVIGNTGGIGAVLRAEPVTGRALASLPEQKIVEVLERRNIPGSGDWVHVRTPEGQEGWVIGLVALPTSRAQ